MLNASPIRDIARTDLGDDIFYLVIGILSDEGFTSAVRRMALVARRFMFMAHRKTFRRVVIGSGVRKRRTAAEMEEWIRLLKELFEASNRDWLRSCVEEVVLFAGRPDQSWVTCGDLRWFMDSVSRGGAFKRFSLISGCLSPWNMRLFRPEFWRACGECVVELALVNVSQIDLAEILARLPNVESVTVSAVDSSSTLAVNEGDKTTRIKKLVHMSRSAVLPHFGRVDEILNRDLDAHLDISSFSEVVLRTDRGADAQFAVTVLKGSGTALRKVTMNVRGALANRHFFEDFSGPKNGLEHLYLWSEFGNWWCQGRSPVDAFAFILPKMMVPSLKTLVLEVRYHRPALFAAIVHEDSDWETLDSCLAGYNGSGLTVVLQFSRQCAFRRAEWEREVVNRLVENPRFSRVRHLATGEIGVEDVRCLLPRTSTNGAVSFDIAASDCESNVDGSEWACYWN